MKHWCLGDTSEHSQRRKSCREFNAIFLKVANFLAQFYLHTNLVDTSNLILSNAALESQYFPGTHIPGLLHPYFPQSLPPFRSPPPPSPRFQEDKGLTQGRPNI